ncbi:MAG TPA: PQQ-binding-like beta-propeller repeat protein [Caldisericia bacterium]|nr:PQQ-binding-like beta-propeller repeat protein [Caldisericia bacterium]
MKKITARALALLIVMSSVFVSGPGVAASCDCTRFKFDLGNNGVFPSECAPENNDLVKRWSYMTGGSVTCAPLVVSGKVYVASWDNKMYCLDAEKGTLSWSAKIGGVLNGICYDSDRVYASCTDKRVYCLDAKTGKQLWVFTMSSASISNPLVYLGKLYAACGKTNDKTNKGDNYIYCLDAKTGKAIWKVKNQVGFEASPAIAGGKIVIGSNDNCMYCFDATNGKQLWKSARVGSEFDAPASISVASGKIYAGNWDKKLYCLDLKTGKTLWTYLAGGPILTTPTIAEGKIYFGSDDGNLYCVDGSSKKLSWKYKTAGKINNSSPVYCAGKIYFGSYDNKLYCLDAKTGKELSSFETKDEVWSTPVICNKKIYFGSNDSNIYCLEARVEKPVRMTIKPEFAVLKPGQNILFTATVYNNYDEVMKDQKITWSLTDPKTGTLDYGGLFGAKSPGLTDIVATSGQLSARAKVYVYDEGLNLEKQGCDWPCFGGDPSRTSSTEADCGPKTDKLKILWKYNAKSPLTTQAISVDGMVFAGAQDGKFHCMDLETGAKIWEFKSGALAYTPVYWQGKLFAPSFDKKLYCLDAKTGKELWSFEAGGEIRTSPTIYQGKLYFGCGKVRDDNENNSGKNALYCLDVLTGKLVWENPNKIDFESSPTVADGKVFIGSSDDTYYCFDANTGDILWTIDSKNDFDGETTYFDGRIYFSTWDGIVRCVDPRSGDAIWTSEIDKAVFGPLAIRDGRIFAISTNKRMFCLSLVDGKVLYDVPMEGSSFYSVACYGNRVVLGDTGGLIKLLDASTGEEKFAYNVKGGKDFVYPSVCGGKILFTNTDGFLYCFVDDDTVEPEKPYPARLVVQPKESVLKPGETQQFTATVFDQFDQEMKDIQISWECSDAEIGSVDQNGLFTAIKDGECTVTATYLELSDTGKVKVLKIAKPEEVTCEWSQYRGNLQRNGVVPDGCGPDPAKTELIWSFETGDDIYSSPTISDGRVFVGSDDNHLYCLDLASGSKIWDFTATGRVFSPAVDSGRVYACSYDRNLYCLDAKTGNKIWSFMSQGPTFSSPVVWENRVYFGSKDHFMYCLDATTGKLLWKFEAPDQVDSSPALWEGKIYFGCEDKSLYCLDALTGKKIWDFKTGYMITSTPAIWNGKVYIGSDDKKLYCLDAQTGSQVWMFEAGGVLHYSSPAIWNGRVFVGATDSFLYCLDSETGKKLWTFRAEGWVTSPAVCGDKVWFGSQDYYFYCVDFNTGEKIWSFKTEGAVSSPAISNGHILAGSFDNKLYCFGAK